MIRKDTCPKKSNILVLSAARGYGGGERSLEELLVPLVRDFRVWLLVENATHERRCKAILSGCDSTTVRLPAGPQVIQLLWGMVWVIFQTLTKRPDFILANSNKSGLILALANWVFPRIGSLAALYVRDFQWRFLSLIARSLRKGVILIPSIAVLEREAYLSSRMRQTGIGCRVVPNIVSRSDCPSSAVGEKRVVVGLGALQRWKGQEYLIKALAHLPASVTAAFYGGVAEPDYAEQLRKLVGQLGLEGRVCFCPYSEDLGAVIAGAICVAVTSISDFGGPETFSRSVMDAWSAERPVVAFAAGGPRVLIEDGRTGLLVPERDWQELASGIARLINDPALAKRLGEGGRAEVRKYESGAVYARFREALAEMLKVPGLVLSDLEPMKDNG